MAGSEKILGVEGGGTKTSWVLGERNAEGLRAIDQGKLPASNFRLTPPDKLQAIFRQMPADIARAGIFLAGCGADDRPALASLCAEIWPQAKIVTGSDRESGLAAGLGRSDGIVVNAGTGASVTGRRGGLERVHGSGRDAPALARAESDFARRPFSTRLRLYPCLSSEAEKEYAGCARGDERAIARTRRGLARRRDGGACRSEVDGG